MHPSMLDNGNLFEVKSVPSLKTLLNLERPVKGVLNGSLAESDGAAHKSFIIKVFGAEIREEGGKGGEGRGAMEGGFHAYGSCPDRLGRSEMGFKKLGRQISKAEILAKCLE